MRRKGGEISPNTHQRLAVYIKKTLRSQSGHRTMQTTLTVFKTTPNQLSQGYLEGASCASLAMAHKDLVDGGEKVDGRDISFSPVPQPDACVLLHHSQLHCLSFCTSLNLQRVVLPTFIPPTALSNRERERRVGAAGNRPPLHLLTRAWVGCVKEHGARQRGLRLT